MYAPLSEKLRPKSLSEVVGQDHLLGQEGLITRIVRGGKPLSLLLFGPPGCGKTTLARLYAQAFRARFVPLSAVFHGTSELKKLIQETQAHPLFNQQLILFIDEIHRFNKAQQDLFLPFVEDGTIVLVGATTENPSFSLNSALLSRLRVLTLQHLNEEALKQILARFETVHSKLPITEEGREYLIHLAQGDGRHLLNLIENLFSTALPDEQLDLAKMQNLLQKRPALYDKTGEGHYNLISALHKSVRGSDPDAALYWLARMFQGGEDPQFLCRRIVRMATEDIGLADPQAIHVALDAWRAYDQLGSPEGELAIAQAIVYLALSPKSNAIYTAFKTATDLAKKTSHLAPPKTILNAPTGLMKELGYGKDYQYDHDTPQGFSGQNYFPDELERPEFYEPVERGFEREMKKRLEYFSNLRKKKPSCP
ncbi:MAG: replication-associated recombination protein A [Rhabdochlamydiaceae bacterium]|nr:replication-associated recombination protein A [Rhabdochlamydiaceae bacterium]